MTNPLFVPPTMPDPPYRALVMGSLQPGYYTATNEARADAILPAMKALLEEWEAQGVRLIGSFDDDLFIVGPPASVDFSIYMLFEVNSLDVLVGMLQRVRETADGVRLDEYIRFEARVGRALFLASDFQGEPGGTVTAARDSREILSDPPPPAADERRAYGPEPLQFGDLRMPAGDGPHPLVVILHGGAWKSTFNLIHSGHMAIALTEAGYATFNVEYRRVGDPGGGWPGSFEDVLLAVDHALKLPGVDRNRVAIAGHSAGGHLALLVASETHLPVVAMAAGSDIESWQSAASFAFVDDGSRTDANPRARVPLRARQVFIHGTDDDQVPYGLSPAFVEASKEAGDEAHLVTLQGAGHFDMIDPQSPHWLRLIEAVRVALGE